jgi:hypothetical protein
MDRKQYDQHTKDVSALVLAAREAHFSLEGWLGTIDPETDADALRSYNRQQARLQKALDAFKGW